MSSLDALQRGLCAAITGTANDQFLEFVVGDGMSPRSRLQIYRNHMMQSLTQSLMATYPVVCRLVSEGFFFYAADEFIRTALPKSPCLHEYGENFPDFLDRFPACQHLVYLGDVARLEWAINEALHAPDADTATQEKVSQLVGAGFSQITFKLHPSVRFARSKWPIETIWQSNQDEGGLDQGIRLDAGGVRLKIHRRGDRVIIRSLSEGHLAFLEQVSNNASLVGAVDVALRLSPDFDLAEALKDLLDDEAATVVGLAG